ncbi:Efflux pump vrtL [Pseudocercospora fuligena]|uniref:Efflux pump vrtL n=1 Tax=Pseudocercospora fuligena TaxID=685502 RepID=A0A8H6RRC2_9PEZI|nr:Efflux pump vrtL [Pseudocercospora fuligena]
MSQLQQSTSKQDFAAKDLTAPEHDLGVLSDANSSDVEIGHRATNISIGAAATLPQEHLDYLIKRHGTLDLDPIPSSDPADPYNWPSWKKMANLVVVGFHAMMTTFIAASIIPVYENIAEDFGTTITRASYLTSLQIMILGWSPLFWRPISYRYGRRPVWLISTIGSLVFNIGCAQSKSYSTMAVCRAFTSFFISPAIAIGSGVVTETYFKKQRAQFMGVWTLLVTLGMLTRDQRLAYQTGDYRWIYYVLAIVNGIQFIAYIFLGPETRYVRRGVEHHGSAFKQEYLTFGRLDPNPLKLYEFIQPLELFSYASIWIPTLSYTFVFGFCSVLLTVEIPQLFVPKFGFNPQQIGLQFLGVIIGSIIGEQIGGKLSDVWMGRKAKSLGYRSPQPEYRLWLSYGGFLLAMVGLIVFGVRLEQAPEGHWNVTPIVGIAIAAVGNQIVTTVLVTYAIDCHVEHSASIGVFVNAIRSTWGFIGPFWFPDMLAALGGSGSGGLMAGLIFVLSWMPIVILQWRGAKWRKTAGPSSPQLAAVEKEAVAKDEGVVNESKASGP